MFRFPWGDFHSLNLGWFLQKFNELREDWATAEAGIDGSLDAEIQKAEDALTDVFAARDAAAASASAANSSALNASHSSLASMDARDQSRAARDAAQQSATNAAASETAAGNSATAASNSAGAAATSETQAGNSATAAQNSATAAAGSATAAGNSAAAAAGSATAAGNSARAAAESETAAENAASRVEDSAQQIATNASDIAILKESVNNIETEVAASFKQKTITDVSIASFDDGADDMPVKKLVVDIEPVQSGTGDPSPDNVRPITGWTGANVVRSGINIWDETWEVGSYRTDNGEKYTDNARIRSADYISVKPNTTYYCKSNTPLKICFYDSDKTFILTLSSVKEISFTTPKNAYFLALTNVAIDYGTTYKNNWSINYPSSDYDYHSGKNNKTYDITFPSEAGIVYGGTLDVTSGTLTVTDAQIASYNGESLPSTWISDRDVYEQGTTPTTGAQVVYKLATPIAYTLTPTEIKTFLGQNNIWADTGDISELTYRVMNDTSAQITLVKAIIAPVIESMIADTALVVNDFRIVNDTLYRVTAPIASGGTLTVGTNVVATTIANVLKSLLN